MQELLSLSSFYFLLKKKPHLTWENHSHFSKLLRPASLCRPARRLVFANKYTYMMLWLVRPEQCILSHIILIGNKLVLAINLCFSIYSLSAYSKQQCYIMQGKAPFPSLHIQPSLYASFSVKVSFPLLLFFLSLCSYFYLIKSLLRYSSESFLLSQTTLVRIFFFFVCVLYSFYLFIFFLRFKNFFRSIS